MRLGDAQVRIHHDVPVYRRFKQTAWMRPRAVDAWPATNVDAKQLAAKTEGLGRNVDPGPRPVDHPMGRNMDWKGELRRHFVPAQKT
jgi:hypothetical protein